MNQRATIFGPRVIHKYCVGVMESFAILLPPGFRVVQVGTQDHQICMWIEIRKGVPHEQMQEVWFAVRGTGHEVPENGTYVGTSFIGRFVWHVYQL